MCEEQTYRIDFEELAVDTKPLPDYLPIERVVNTFPSLTERYFTPKFKLNEQFDNAENDQCILIHSNKICLFVLPPNHPVILQNKTVVGVKYDVTVGYLSGKKKRGSPKLQQNQPLCTLSCEDGSTYSVKCGIKGNLIEINDKLTDNPQLIATKPWAEGYIAIAMLPLYLKHSLSEEFGFVSLEEYEEKRQFVAKAERETL